MIGLLKPPIADKMVCCECECEWRSVCFPIKDSTKEPQSRKLVATEDLSEVVLVLVLMIIMNASIFR